MTKKQLIRQCQMLTVSEQDLTKKTLLFAITQTLIDNPTTPEQVMIIVNSLSEIIFVEFLNPIKKNS